MYKIYTHILLALIIILFIFGTAEASPPREPFYSVGNNTIDIRSIAPSDSASFITAKTKEGKEYKLQNPPILNSRDFIGISKKGGTIVFHFKKVSWKKVRKWTATHINKEIAVVINNKIYSVAILRESLTRTMQAGIVGDEKINLGDYFKELSQTNAPEYLDSPKEYLSFLELWVSENPNDISTIKELAYLYISDGSGEISANSMTTDNCSLAIPLLNNVVKKKPNDTFYHSLLSQCYLIQGNFSKAIKTLEASEPYTDKQQKWTLYMELGLAHIMNGSYEKAIAILKEAKSILQNISFLPAETDDVEMAKMFFGGAINPEVGANIDTVEKLENYLKKESFSRLEDLINKAKEGMNK